VTAATQPAATLPDVLAERLRGRGRGRGRVVLVGIGNPLLGDDAAGCLVARGVKGTPGIDVIESDDVPERDVLRIADAKPDVVVLADAVDLGAPAGSVALLEPDALAGYAPTTHRVPLSLIATLLRRAAAADVLVLAIQPRQMAPGAGVSPEVARSVEALVGMIRTCGARAAQALEEAPC
jgi:hydrogenase 3 maturation protease